MVSVRSECLEDVNGCGGQELEEIFLLLLRLNTKRCWCCIIVVKVSISGMLLPP